MFGLHYIFTVSGYEVKTIFFLNGRKGKRIFFSLGSDSTLPCKEYVLAMDELTVTLNGKKYADIRGDGLLAIGIVQKQTITLDRTKENVCSLIRLFYGELYLRTVEDIWHF